jgi:16S rRNA (guanine527-N7)-methyltransferase
MFHVKHEDRAGDARRVGVALDPHAVDRLGVFEGLLRERAIALGMIADGDRDRLWERHIVDSLRGAALVTADGGRARRVADLGSGAGLPGIPIAVALPDVAVVLVEPRQRRAAFLELVVERLGLENASVEARRAQELAVGFDVCLARALAPPSKVWAIAEPLLTTDGRVLVWVGAGDHAWPSGARVSLRPTPHLVNAGPIAIMTRQ